MTEYQFERACDISYALERYEEAMDLLQDKAHCSLMVVYEPENGYSNGQNIKRERKIVDNSATDFVREMIEEHQERLIKEIKERIEKLNKEVAEL